MKTLQVTANDLPLTFPVLWLHGKRHLMIAPTEESIRILPSADIKTTLIGARFIDIRGYSGQVQTAHSLGGVGPLFGLSVFITLRIVRVAVVMDLDPTPLSFESVKTQVLNILSLQPTSAAHVQKIAKAESIAGIMQALGDGFVVAKWRPWGMFRNAHIEDFLPKQAVLSTS